MRKFFSIFIICMTLLIFSSNLVIANEKGGKEGHGGDVVDVGGSPVLRDLVTRTNCEWANPEVFLAPIHASFEAILSTVSETHWYLSHRIRRGLKHISAICLVDAPLHPITQIEDQDALSPYEKNARQIAIRIKDKVYLNRQIYNSMANNHQRAYLWIHEASHELFAQSLNQRSSKHRSFVSTIRRNEIKRMSSSDFAFQLTNNEVGIIPDVSSFSELKTPVLGALNESLKIIDRINFVKQFRKLKVPSSTCSPSFLQYEDCDILANISKPLDDKFTALLDTQDYDAMIKLLHLGANPNALVSSPLKEYVPQQIYPLLNRAIETNNLVLLKALLESDDLDLSSQWQVDGVFQSPLRYAMGRKRFEQAELLLKHPRAASITTPREANEILEIAIRQNRPELVELIIKTQPVGKYINTHGEESSSYTGMRSRNPNLIFAIRSKNLEILKAILTIPGIDVNVSSSNFTSGYLLSGQPYIEPALATAVEVGSLEMVLELLKFSNLDPNKPIEAGVRASQPPFFLALQKGRLDLAIAIASHPNFNPSSKEIISSMEIIKNQNAYSAAILSGNESLIRLILKNPKADPSIKNSDQSTPFTLAFTTGRYDLAKQMLKTSKTITESEVTRGIWRDSKSNWNSAFSIAITLNDQELVEALLRVSGVSPSSIVWQGSCKYIVLHEECSTQYDALTFAKKLKRKTIYQYLTEFQLR